MFRRIAIALATFLVSAWTFAAVNINTATKEELDGLPGIGPVKAQAIVDYRKANGPFKSPEDIMRVKGIKEGEFGKIKDQISVSGATSAPAAAAAKAAAPAPAPAAAPAPAPAPAPGPAAKAEPAKAAAPAAPPPAAPAAKQVPKAAPKDDKTKASTDAKAKDAKAPDAKQSDVAKK